MPRLPCATLAGAQARRRLPATVLSVLVAPAHLAAAAGQPPDGALRLADLARGLQVEQVVRGDLDGDSRPDAALVLAEPAQTPSGRRIIHRHLLVALQTREGRHRPVARSRVALLRADEGGVFGDPLEGVTIRGRVLVVSHYGGSNWRWAHTDRFAWLGGQLRYIGRTDTTSFTGDGSAITRDTNLATGDVIVQRQAGRATPRTDRHHFHEIRAVPVASLPPWQGAADWEAPVTRLRRGATRLRVQACIAGDALFMRVAGAGRAVPTLRRAGPGPVLAPTRTWRQGERWLARYRLPDVPVGQDEVLDELPRLTLQYGAASFAVTLRRKGTPGGLTLADCVRAGKPD
ncbi:MAG: hypothetical protein VKQ33_13220 [Candidatus Sericytochromatia bacterium]|nr:hypothetical protein [Candidatus Sericytochromatia bacterium]